MTTQFEIGLIGAGNAAEGIVHGVLRRSMLLDDRIIASDPHEQRRQLFADRFRIRVTDDNRFVVENSYIIILAVKPQQFQDVVGQVADLVRPDHLVVSIMAGVSTKSIEAALPGDNQRVVRVMPNLPMHVGEGMAGVYCGRHAQEVDRLHAQRIFDAGGKSIVIEDESLMDAVTAVSGSGPAYFYYFVESLIRAGEQAGLTHQEAAILAKQSCLGAAKMMLESGDSPEMLRKKVSSPGGTTEAAINCMNKNGVDALLQEGFLAAWHRSQELGR